jgi:branched-chain amino acid transport system permease protein
MIDMLQYTIDGALKGLLYSIIALAFIVVYRAGRILNFAQGEVLVFLGYFVWTFAVMARFPLWLVVPSSLVVAFLFGISIERIVFRPLIAQPIWAIVMVTIGLMIVLQGVILVIWGATERPFPVIFPEAPVKIGPLIFMSSIFWGGLTAFLIAFVLYWVFERTRWGLKLTAVAEDHQVAQSMGISVKRAVATAWVISSAISTFAIMVLLSGQSLEVTSAVIGLKALPVVLLAGIESLGGAIIAGLIVGLGEGLAAAYLDPYTDGVMSQVFPYALMLLILMVRPQGLFGWKIIERV